MINRMWTDVVKLATLRRTGVLMAASLAWCAFLGWIAAGMAKAGASPPDLRAVLPLLPTAVMVTAAVMTGEEFGPQLRTSLLAEPNRRRLVGLRWTVLTAVIVVLSAASATGATLILGAFSPAAKIHAAAGAVALTGHLAVCGLVAALLTEAARSPVRGCLVSVVLLWIGPFVLRLAWPTGAQWLPFESSAGWLLLKRGGHAGWPVFAWLGVAALVAALSWRRDL